MNLANFFTLLRFVLTPVVAWGIITGRPVLTLIVFAAAAFTDYLDGAVARRTGRITPAGAVLDPIADKCLLSGIFLAMAVAGMVPWWFVGIVFGRDLYILLGAGILLLTTGIRKFPPSIWGKVSTCVQIGTAMAWLVRNIVYVGVTDWLARGGLWICSGFTIWSGLHYTWRAVKIIRQNAHSEH